MKSLKEDQWFPIFDIYCNFCSRNVPYKDYYVHTNNHLMQILPEKVIRSSATVAQGKRPFLVSLFIFTYFLPFLALPQWFETTN